MTIQPNKNEPAVVPMVSKQTIQSQTSHLTLDSEQKIKQPSAKSDRLQSLRNVHQKEKLSGAMVAPEKDSAVRLSKVREQSVTRSIEAAAAQTASAVNIKMDSLKEAILHLAKNYPPFMGDKKREEYLMGINGIRQQIQEMIYPPDFILNPVDSGIPQTAVKELWQSLFWDVKIPTLPVSGADEATNQQLQSTITSVTSMQTNLAGRIAVLVQQTQQPLMQLSSSIAESISNSAGQDLALYDFSITTNLSGVLKNL